MGLSLAKAIFLSPLCGVTLSNCCFFSFPLILCIAQLNSFGAADISTTFPSPIHDHWTTGWSLYSLLLILLVGRSLFSIAHLSGILPVSFSLLLGLSLFSLGGSFSLSLNSDSLLLSFPLHTHHDSKSGDSERQIFFGFSLVSFALLTSHSFIQFFFVFLLHAPPLPIRWLREADDSRPFSSHHLSHQHWTLTTKHCTLTTVSVHLSHHWPPLYSKHWTLFISNWHLHFEHWALYTLHTACPLHTAHNTLDVQCTLHTARYTHDTTQSVRTQTSAHSLLTTALPYWDSLRYISTSKLPTLPSEQLPHLPQHSLVSPPRGQKPPKSI